MMLSGSHNVIERCIFDGNRDTGLQISRRSSAVTNYKDWPSYNTILNCTSKNNCDPATYENADGFAAKLTCGDGNLFDGCISYNNSDDGWDLFAKTATGPIGVVTIRNCIAMRNGITEDGTTKSSCDGNGFTDNNNPSALKLSNCTAFDNNKGGSKNNFSLYRCKDAVVSSCISYTTNGAAIISSSSQYGSFSKDGLAIGARFAESNKVKALTVNAYSNSSTVISGGGNAEKPSESDKPVNPPVEEPSKPSGDLSELKICYYFTGDGAEAFQGSIYGGISYTRAPWYVSLDGRAKISVKKMSKLSINADSCAEITFSGDDVLDNTAALNINLSIAKSDWSNFDQSNDYSYNDASKVIVYYDGVVVSGKAF